jgi:hypothetical protein
VTIGSWRSCWLFWRPRAAKTGKSPPRGRWPRFGWGGWTLGSTAKEIAGKSASSAVIAALAPICVDKFQRATGAEASLAELKKVSSWEQATFVEKGGWATLPGSDTANSSVARACAELLGSLK